VAHGDTVLQAGDRLTVFTNDDCMPIVRERLVGGIDGA
jgi:Trk K+ transport system NAD-binding subunit